MKKFAEIWDEVKAKHKKEYDKELKENESTKEDEY